MLKQLLTILICTALGPFIVYEGVRFYKTYIDCRVGYDANEMLISNSVCSDAWQRLHLGSKQDEACKLAEDENALARWTYMPDTFKPLVNSVTCASQKMWTQGEVKRVWAMFTESYWMLAAVTVPSILTVIYLCFSSWTERAKHDKTLAFQREMYDKTLEMVSQQQHRREYYYSDAIEAPTPAPLKSRKFIELVDTRRPRYG